MSHESIHTRIRQKREELGFTEAQMAEELGICRCAYINFELGKTKLFSKTLSLFAGYLDMSEEEFLIGSDTGSDLLRSGKDWKEERKSLIDDYENRLAKKNEDIRKLNSELEFCKNLVHTLRTNNEFILSHIDKNV